MVADWFAGDEIATAMAIFVNSWLAGTALSLLTLPLIGAAHVARAVRLAVAALGLMSGQPAGPMMSLPAGVLQPMPRAIGMGLFYTVYYAAMMLGPIAGGACAKWGGSAAAAFDFGAVVLVACPLLLWVFNR